MIRVKVTIRWLDGVQATHELTEPPTMLPNGWAHLDIGDGYSLVIPPHNIRHLTVQESVSVPDDLAELNERPQ